MKQVLIATIFLLINSGCELFVIGTKQLPQIELTQNSALGAVYLFKAELDSNNIPAASHILANSNGSEYLAFEKYELYDELERLGRIIGNKPITKVVSDSVNDSRINFNMEFDYLKSMKFITLRINDLWYIVEYSD